MEVPLDLRSVAIVMILFLGINCTEVEESLPSRRVVVQKPYRYHNSNNRMSSRGFIQEGPKFWNGKLIPTVDPHIDSLMRCTAYLIDTLRRLEVKFDRVFGAVNFEENVANEVSNTLRLIYQHMKSNPTNAHQTDCSSSVNGMPQNDLMRELVDAVKYTNENMRKLVTNFDMVIESGRRSMQSLEKVASTVQDIDQRTIRIQQTSSGQFSSGTPNLYRDETLGSAKLSSTLDTGVNAGSNNYEITKNNSPTSSNQHLVTQTSYSNANGNPSGGGAYNWDKNPQASFNGYEDKTRNTDQVNQSATRTPPTNYDRSGNSVGTSSLPSDYGSGQNRNSVTTYVKENTNVSHNQNSYQGRKEVIQESKVTDHNTTPIAPKPSVSGASSWNSYETFVGEPNQNRNIGQNNNDRVIIQQTQQSYQDSASTYNNKRPTVSPSSTSFASREGEVHSWNSSSNKSSNQEIKPGVAQTNNYDAVVRDVFVVPSNTNYESNGIVVQNSVSSSNGQLKVNENVGRNVVVTHNRTSYDSKGSVAVDRNVNPTVTSTGMNYQPGKTEVHSSSQVHNNNYQTTLTTVTKEKEITDQTTRTVAPAAASNGASSTTLKSKETNITSRTNDPTTLSHSTTTTTTTTTTAKPTTTTTTTAKPPTTTTTTTTAKPQTNVDTINSQRTYRSLRKDAKRVTFEADKRNCHDLTVKRNGIYKFGSQDEIANDGNRFFYERYCDFYTDNRAWTVIQRRFADYSQESFNRTWGDYKHGFGSLDDEFWFGNDFIHKLTFDDDVELRILVEDENGKTNWVEYSLFKMKSEKDNYKLVIGGYSSGSVGDTLLYHNDQEFTTYDHLNGNNQQTSCASSIGNGWWFKNCSDKAILGNFLGSTSTKMMIRPKK